MSFARYVLMVRTYMCVFLSWHAHCACDWRRLMLFCLGDYLGVVKHPSRDDDDDNSSILFISREKPFGRSNAKKRFVGARDISKGFSNQSWLRKKIGVANRDSRRKWNGRLAFQAFLQHVNLKRSSRLTSLPRAEFSTKQRFSNTIPTPDNVFKLTIIKRASNVAWNFIGRHSVPTRIWVTNNGKNEQQSRIQQHKPPPHEQRCCQQAWLVRRFR